MSETRNRETEDRDRRCNKDRRDKSLPKGPTHKNVTMVKHRDRITDRGDREPDRRTEERRKNWKYCQIYMISF